MKFKIGVGILLFGILLANGAVFDIGGYLFVAGIVIGAVGLSMITFENDNDNNNEQK